MKFTIPGEPVGKERPRGGKGNFYTPERTVAYERLVRHCYRAAAGDYFGSMPIRIDITAYYRIPESESKVKREKMERGTLLPTKRPDFDNVAKIVCDALNDLAYRDDAQIAEAHFCKRYSKEPRVEVNISTVEDDCGSCIFSPPSSLDGKPCSYCDTSTSYYQRKE